MRRVMSLTLGVLLSAFTISSGDERAKQARNGRQVEPAAALQPDFWDDFGTDSRDQYEIEGNVTWQRGRLTLDPGTTIARAIDSGAEGVVELSIALPEPAEEGESSNAALRIRFVPGIECVIVWSQSRAMGRVTGSVRVVGSVPQSFGPPQQLLIREWPLGSQEVSGRWQIRYRFGLITLAHLVEGTGTRSDVLSSDEWFPAYLRNGSAAVRSVAVTAERQGVTLEQFGARAVPPRLLEPEEQQRLAETERLNRRIVELYLSGGVREAVPLAARVLGIHQEVLGEDHRDYAVSLTNLATIYRFLGDYANAEPLYLQARDIFQKILGEDHPDYATSLNYLALIYYLNSDYAKAEPLYIQSHDIYKVVLGEAHPLYATSLDNLAVMYRSMGDYARAEPLHLRARDIRRQILGEEHLDYAVSLSNLGLLYWSMGDGAQAEPFYLQARKIREKVLGKEHPEYAAILNNLAVLYSSMGRYAQAEPLYREVRDIYGKLLDEEHPKYGVILSNLALLYSKMGDDARAEPLYLQSRDIHRKVLGEDHPDYAGSLNNLAGHYSSMGHYGRAESLYRQVSDIFKQAFGEEHPDYAGSLSNLALLYLETGESAKAHPVAREALEVGQRHLERTLPWLPEAQAVSLLSRQTGAGDWLSVVRDMPGEVSPVDIWSAVWRSQGLVSAMLFERRLGAFAAPEAAPLVEQLRSVQQQLAQQTLAVPTTPEQRESRQRRLAALNEEKENLERKLASVSAEFREVQEQRDIAAEDLLPLLPAGMALVDLAEVTIHRPPPKGKGDLESARHYEAFVVRAPEGEGDEPTVVWVHLGPSEPINAALRWWREAIAQRRPEAGAAAGRTSPAMTLRRLVWEPIEEHLEGSDSVILIPDGELTVLPWGALPGTQPGTYLLENYALSTASHGRQLYALLTDQSEPTGGLLLVGGINYDRRETAPTPAAPDQEQTLLARSKWDFLPGTVAEVEQLEKLWPDVPPPRRLTGTAVTEEALQAELPQARYIHLATHGFFADPQFRSMFAHDVEGERLFGGGWHVSGAEGHNPLPLAPRASVTARNPLILSGVVLAGANLPLVTDDLGLPTGADGILTAEEVVGLDLRSTELVVLSACETGLGEVGGGGEGVFGLQRAFHLAGARCVVASLWKVEDRATQALMVEFYRNLWEEGLSKGEALRQAQLAMMTDYDRQAGQIRGIKRLPGPVTPGVEGADGIERLPPYFWGGFLLSGDWR